MKIAFLDLTGIDYEPTTPERLPLGGMQSGACYLMRQLAERGHEVTLFNASKAEGRIAGIEVRNFDSRFAAECTGHDAYVSLSCRGRVLRSMTEGKPLILYSGHSSAEASMQVLSDPEERSCWDHFVFKSNWQASLMVRTFGLDRHRISIITNAVSPAFAQLGDRRSYFFREGRPPVLYYSSTPFRGLEVLAEAFPAIARACPGVTARIYSSMDPYQAQAADQDYQPLYDLCRRTGMDYVGSLSQPELAKAVSAADILAFPSIYPETSCVTIMEAMANSALIVSRNLGAIPETSAGFAVLAAGARTDDARMMAQLFAQTVVQAVAEARSKPGIAESRLRLERRYCLTNYSWTTKAREWEDLLRRVATQPRHRTGRTAPGIFHYVQTLSGRRIYMDHGDGRARRLLRHGGSFNPATMLMWRRALAQRPWDIIVDVGASYGEMLIEDGVRRCPRVLAVEPNPRVLPYLAMTLAGAANVQILPIALSDHEGEAPFAINRGWSGMSGLGEGPQQITVRVRTLDSVLETALSPTAPAMRLLLKIDVEGHDVEVLKGARQSIARAADFCCLIEAPHLSGPETQWLRESFRIHALSLRDGRLVEIDDLGMLADGKRFWDHDVILTRRNRPGDPHGKDAPLSAR